MSRVGEELKAELGAPVLDSDSAAIRFTEMLVWLRETHGRKAYPS
jgi:Asp/Glu/hydantoin racemase